MRSANQLGGASGAGAAEGGTTGSPQWLSGSLEPIYTVLHLPPPGTARSTAIVMVPPFGWEDLISHRARRYWASRLAEHGFPALRLDLPGTGDSAGSPADPGLLGRWTTALADAAEWLRGPAVGAERVVAIGVGLGGLLTCAAISEGAAIDDVLLWASRAQGRGLVRELVAFSGMLVVQAGGHVETTEPVVGGTDVAGFFLSDELRGAVSALDVATMGFPAREGRRALLLGRDVDPDPSLIEALRSQGFEVTAEAGTDFASLMSHPEAETGQRPEAAIARSLAWLSEPEADQGTSLQPTNESRRPFEAASGARLEAELTVPGGRVRETIVPISPGGVRSFAILAEPVRAKSVGVAAVIVNAGAIRKIGLQRMSVEIARRWALEGVPTLRFDLEGIGDADGPGDQGADERAVLSVSPESVATVQSAMNELRDLGVADRFVMVGHCSGAFHSFHEALVDPSVVGVIGVNQPYFVKSQELYQERVLTLTLRALRANPIRRVLRKGIRLRELRELATAILYRLRRRGEATGDLHMRQGKEFLDQLAERGVSLRMFFTDANLFHGELIEHHIIQDKDRWPNLHVSVLPTIDHNLHSIATQRLVHQLYDDALHKIVSETEPSGGPGGLAPRPEPVQARY